MLSPDGKNWILNGQKMWITNGGFADVFIVFAKVDGEKFSCFIVEKGYPGFSVGAEEKKMGIKGSSTVPIFFENCPVPERKSAYTKSAAATSSLSILSTPAAFRSALIASAEPRKFSRPARNIPRNASRSASSCASSA